jgi:hypothetical protein
VSSFDGWIRYDGVAIRGMDIIIWCDPEIKKFTWAAKKERPTDDIAIYPTEREAVSAARRYYNGVSDEKLIEIATEYSKRTGEKVRLRLHSKPDIKADHVGVGDQVIVMPDKRQGELVEEDEAAGKYKVKFPDGQVAEAKHEDLYTLDGKGTGGRVLAFHMVCGKKVWGGSDGQVQKRQRTSHPIISGKLG